MKYNWQKGAPPKLGWYYTIRKTDNRQAWRWWDGMHWSVIHREHQTRLWAKTKSPYTVDDIKWCDYWPENARVPRIQDGL